MPRGIKKDVQNIKTLHCERCDKDIAARGFKAHQTWHRKQDNRNGTAPAPKPVLDMDSYRAGFRDGWKARDSE